MSETDFSTQIPEASFVDQTYATLNRLGFTPGNSIPCVALCRDELTVPLLNLINRAWGSEPDNCQAFIMHSLAGMLLLGKTGMKAATSHAPHDEKDGRMRYIFYCFAHIGLNDQGVHGLVRRHGMRNDSKACGALAACRDELLQGNLDDEIDPHDIEQSLLKQRLIKKIRLDQEIPNFTELTEIPSLAKLTKIASAATLQDLEKLILLTINSNDQETLSDYAVFTGVQINHGKHVNSVWPSTSYVVVEGKRTDFGTDHWDVGPPM